MGEALGATWVLAPPHPGGHLGPEPPEKVAPPLSRAHPACFPLRGFVASVLTLALLRGPCPTAERGLRGAWERLALSSVRRGPPGAERVSVSGTSVHSAGRPQPTPAP